MGEFAILKLNESNNCLICHNFLRKVLLLALDVFVLAKENLAPSLCRKKNKALLLCGLCG